MAVRIPQTNHNGPAKRDVQAHQLLQRVQAHKRGTLKLTRAQILAANIVIAKCIPMSERRTHR